MIQEVNAAIRKVFQQTEVTKHVNKNNSDHSILFEAMRLTLCMGEDAKKDNVTETIQLLAKYVGLKENNIRFIALEMLTKAMPVQLQSVPNLLKENFQSFLTCLKEQDISVRKAALDNLFQLANEESSSEIINELLDHLQEKEDYPLMEEIVLKVAVLAERFAINLSWYIDVIIKLIEYAGDYTSEDLWFRVAQMVTGFSKPEQNSAETDEDDNLKKYAALRIIDVMKKPNLHETLVRIGAYVLSEFGNLIANEPGKSYQE